MRSIPLALGIAITLACASTLAQSDRYGASPAATPSTIDFEDAFKNLPQTGSATGGYRSPAATGKTPATNELRTLTPPPSSARVSTPSSARTASPPIRSTPPSTSARSPSASPRGGASSSNQSGSRAYQTPPASSTYSATSRNAAPLQSRFDATAPAVSGERERNARQILSKMLNYNGASELTGTPMSLASVVASSVDRNDQAQRVVDYWMLSSSMADYYLGLAEVNEINALKRTAPSHSAAINEALSKQRVRVGTALKAARAAQHRLAQQMGQGGMLPLPSDIPFTGPYNTRLSTAFPAGAPAEARLLDELLPLRLAEIYDAADAISQSQAWFKQVAQRATANSDAEGVVRGLQLNALNRRAFVMLVRDYNLRISRYTQLTTPERVDTGRLVAMLIRTPNAGRSADDALMAGFSAGAGGSADSRFGTGAPSRR